MKDIIPWMKDTGMHRKVDDLGRIVLPAEMRKSFGIKEGDLLDISVDEDRIILSLATDSCVFCRSKNDLKEFREKTVCAACIRDLTNPTQPDWDPFAT